jgi:phage shock protein E
MRNVSLMVALLALVMAVACGASTDADLPLEVKVITVSEAKPLVDAAYSQFIDVRTSDEYKEGHAPRTRNIPLDTLVSNLDLIERNEPVYIICRTDNRSREAAKVLTQYGFKKPIIVKGGTDAWRAAGYPIVQKTEDSK